VRADTAPSPGGMIVTTMKKVTTYRLVPELVPFPLWGVSAYQALGKTKPWKEIRQDALEKSSHRCESCDSDGPRLSCHDKWEYDDKKCVASLVGFEIRCPLCHLATHIGRANAEGFGQDAIQQLCKVNRCTERDAEQIVAAAMSLWDRRSKKKWTVVAAPALLKGYPRLQEVPLMVTSTT
jgi:hypothetical protein